MKRKTARFSLIASLFFIIGLFICTTYTHSYAGKNFLWRAQSNGGTVYILGSIHLLKKDIYPLSRTIENAFEKSAVLAVEADINDIGKLDIGKLMARAFYPANDTLEKHVSGDTFNLVKEEAQRLGLPAEFVYNQKPWFLGLTLSSIELLKAGYGPDYGIDKYFLSRAAGKKKVMELESLDYQIDLLSGLNDKEQETFLLYMLKDLRILGQEVDKLVEAWKSGAMESMDATIRKSFMQDGGFSGVYEKLIYERNRSMALKIEGYLKTNRTYFVVVGAAHLLGDRGIIRLLKDRGYSIEQL